MEVVGVVEVHGDGRASDRAAALGAGVILAPKLVSAAPTAREATGLGYFFVGPQSSIPPPMESGWGGVYGSYNGQQGWIVTFYC